MATLDSSRSANPPRPARSPLRQAALAGLVASVVLALGLGDPPFVDEYAYITQSYQPDLLLEGRTDDPAWLEALTYDLVPLPKYLINGAYRIAGLGRPRRLDAAAWYDNTSYKWGSSPQLLIARLPSVLMAALGCAGIFCVGTKLRDTRAGWLAAGLLAMNPLYRLHAHRAMSEAPCEALSLVALALAISTWKRMLNPERSPLAAWAGMTASGFFAGLALLAKFNGVLVLATLSAWAVLGLALPRIATARKAALAAATAMACVLAFATFVALNPFMTAHPQGPLPPRAEAIAALGTWQRFRFLMEHRFAISRGQQAGFPHNALLTLSDRIPVLAVQGFGRFGPLGPSHSDSTRRFDLAQDWGALLWLPLAMASLAWAVLRGLRELRSGELPLSWLAALWACLAIAVVTAYLPMAWDRYQLPIQAPVALLVALAASDAARALGGRPSSPPSRP